MFLCLRSVRALYAVLPCCLPACTMRCTSAARLPAHVLLLHLLGLELPAGPQQGAPAAALLLRLQPAALLAMYGSISLPCCCAQYGALLWGGCTAACFAGLTPSIALHECTANP